PELRLGAQVDEGAHLGARADAAAAGDGVGEDLSPRLDLDLAQDGADVDPRALAHDAAAAQVDAGRDGAARLELAVGVDVDRVEGLEVDAARGVGPRDAGEEAGALLGQLGAVVDAAQLL